MFIQFVNPFSDTVAMRLKSLTKSGNFFGYLYPEKLLEPLVVFSQILFLDLFTDLVKRRIGSIGVSFIKIENKFITERLIPTVCNEALHRRYIFITQFIQGNFEFLDTIINFVRGFPCRFLDIIGRLRRCTKFLLYLSVKFLQCLIHFVIGFLRILSRC